MSDVTYSNGFGPRSWEEALEFKRRADSAAVVIRLESKDATLDPADQRKALIRDIIRLNGDCSGSEPIPMLEAQRDHLAEKNSSAQSRQDAGDYDYETPPWRLPLSNHVDR